jgi:aldehyde:ferredoxin oxidoreductase
MYGCHGRYLRVDASSRRAECVPLSEPTLRLFLGGVGLGTLLLARETPTRVDPLGADAALVFALGPLVGTPLTTSAKFAVVAISPLTRRTCDALASSRFALATKRCGVDAIVVRGRCEAPSLLFIDGQGRDEPEVSWKPADELWGLSASDAEIAIRKAFGPDWEVSAIGPAGERLVPFATISHDGRHAGRGGLGAVMGAKGIKAIAVRGDRRVRLADPDATVALARDLSRRSFGPATAKYRELGTIANLLTFNRLRTLPTRNFATDCFDEAVNLLPDEDGGPRLRSSCAACTIGCEHGFDVGGRTVRMEYETLYALGPLCGTVDRDSLLRAAKACDDAGLDTISTGGTIAFLMDCAEQGWLDDDRLPSGRCLRFGDGETLVEAIEMSLRCEGLGRLIALGSRRAAEQIGGAAPDRAMHVKGLELPGYDPRRLPAMALGLAVGTRGADHNRSGAYQADFSGAVDEHSSAEATARAAIDSEDQAAIIDSLILCKFLRGVFPDLGTEAADMLRAVTGWPVSAKELQIVAHRVVNARKCLNEREGWTVGEDTLPKALREADGARLGTRLEEAITAYYRLRGWDDAGRVPRAVRQELDLQGPEFG